MIFAERLETRGFPSFIGSKKTRILSTPKTICAHRDSFKQSFPIPVVVTATVHFSYKTKCQYIKAYFMQALHHGYAEIQITVYLTENC
ncbi:MAG: hypothetical protein EA411_10950 [Saprospirales bacterium]|nr:MAG: hypothetical protein EA411_10950 [Saprospirales bacterium]